MDGRLCPSKELDEGVRACFPSQASRLPSARTPSTPQSGKSAEKESALAPLLQRLLSCSRLIHFLLFGSPQLLSDGGGRLPSVRETGSVSSPAGICNPDFWAPGSPTFCRDQASTGMAICDDWSGGRPSTGASLLLVLLVLEHRRAKAAQRSETALGRKVLTVCASRVLFRH